MISGFVIAPAMVAFAVADWHRGWKKTFADQTLLIAGAVAATLLLGLISLSVGENLFSSSLRSDKFYGTSANNHFSAWQTPVSRWLPQAYRLLIPATASIWAMVFFGRGAVLAPAIL